MRIRTVKPEFFTHEAIFEAEIESGLPLRLSFIGLWCCADRDGKFKWEPRRLGVNILPYDNFDFSEILDALGKFGFVVRFGGGKFGLIPSFKNHQCINQREAQSQIPDPVDDCTETHVHAYEPQYNYRGVNIQPKLRAFVFLRDDNKCVRCGSDEDLTVDHIFPQSIGGTHAKQNLRTLCRSCNSARPVAGNALIEDLAKDGLSLDDMERMCMHVCARGEGKGMEGNKEVERKGSPPNPQGGLGMEIQESKPSDPMPKGWQKMNAAQRSLARVNFNTPQMLEFGNLMARKESTLWTVAEAAALMAVNPQPDEIELARKYYHAEIEKKDDYRRRDIITLLNNWNGELDRARIFITSKP